MRFSILAAVMLFSSLAFASSTKNAGDNYSLETKGTTTEVGVKKQGLFKLQLKPAAGFKISREAPLKIVLDAGGVDLSKKSLGQKDADDEKSDAPVFNVDFKPTEVGKKTIAVDATFVVCNDTVCEKKKHQLSVDVTVKP